jgi:hypothetical protein
LETVEPDSTSMPKRLRIAYLAALAICIPGPGLALYLSPVAWLGLLFLAWLATVAWYVANLPGGLTEWSDRPPGAELEAAVRKGSAVVMLVAAAAWAGLKFFDPLRGFVFGGASAVVGLLIGGLYARERMPAIRGRWGMLVPITAGALIGYGLATVAQTIYEPWLDYSPYRRDERPTLFAIPIGIAGLVGLLVDLRDAVSRKRAAENRGWDAATAFLLAIGILLPPACCAYWMLELPSEKPFHFVGVMLVVGQMWSISMIAVASGLTVQIVRKRWNLSLTGCAVVMQAAFWLVVGLYVQSG